MKDAGVFAHRVALGVLLLLASCARIDAVLYPGDAPDEDVFVVLDQEVLVDGTELDDADVARPDLSGCSGVCELDPASWETDLAATNFDLDSLSRDLGLGEALFSRSEPGLPLRNCLDYGKQSSRTHDAVTRSDGVTFVVITYEEPALASKLVGSAFEVIDGRDRRLDQCRSNGRTIRRVVELDASSYVIDVTELSDRGASTAIAIEVTALDSLRVLISIDRTLDAIR